MNNKFLTIFALLLAFGLFTSANAQLAKNSWSFGFGGTYGKLVNHNLSYGTSTSYGGYLSIQRNFTEHVSLRMRGYYLYLEGVRGNVTTEISAFGADFDLLYYFVPCESVSPYLLVGVGPVISSPDNAQDPRLDGETELEKQFNIGLGAEWMIDADWELKTEIAYKTIGGSNFDGQYGPGVGGLIGGPYDSYMVFDLGVLYYFDKGEPSKYCELYDGLSRDMPDPVDYERIENMIKKHIPKEVVKEVVVEKPVGRSDRVVLVGVNFAFDSAKLRPESYPILRHAVFELLENPDVNVTVEGHTDNIGSESYNQKLSEQRAMTVKNYLVSKGVDAGRITTVGKGESDPIADNKTAEGRAYNRRIEFIKK